MDFHFLREQTGSCVRSAVQLLYSVYYLAVVALGYHFLSQDSPVNAIKGRFRVNKDESFSVSCCRFYLLLDAIQLVAHIAFNQFASIF